MRDTEDGNQGATIGETKSDCRFQLAEVREAEHSQEQDSAAAGGAGRRMRAAPVGAEPSGPLKAKLGGPAGEAHLFLGSMNTEGTLAVGSRILSICICALRYTRCRSRVSPEDRSSTTGNS